MFTQAQTRNGLSSCRMYLLSYKRNKIITKLQSQYSYLAAATSQIELQLSSLETAFR